MAEYLISELEVPEVGKTLIFKDKEARNDLSTAVVETSASNPLTFTTRSAQNAQSAEIVLEPIQDLHGYDHPWVGGAGKNKLPKTPQTGSNTIDGITWTVNDDGSIKVSGTATARSLFYYLPAGSYDTLNGEYTVSVEGLTAGVAAGFQIGGNWKSANPAFTTTYENATIQQLWIDVGQRTTVDTVIKPMIRLATETDPTFAPYSNYCPISGHTEVSLKVTNGKESTDPDYEVATDLTKDLGQEVFGASYNPVSGELVVTWGYIAEYNGETLPGEWISDRDVYAPNTSPSTGAEVCYELATPITYHLTPDEIKLLSGVNTIWTDGTSIKVAYRDGKVATLADLTDTANNLQEQIDQNETMEDETTQLLYKLGVNNGLLFIEEV